MKVSVIGIDLAKDVFQVHGADAVGRVIVRKRLSRRKLIEWMAQIEPCLVLMEACIGSHYWARTFLAMGHEVRLIAPQFVKPFVKSNKNDASDAEAIVEAGLRPSMRFVTMKEPWQQDIQHIHRVRERLVRNRTSLSNEIRSLLLEYGISVPRSIANLKKSLGTILGGHPNLSPLAVELFQSLHAEFFEIQERIEQLERVIVRCFKANESAQRLAKIEGIGPMTATAMIGSVGNFRAFKNGRQFSAWLGLVPRQHSSGNHQQLLGISKRGDVYLRKLLIHGSRSALTAAKRKNDPRSRWLKEKEKLLGANKACVAFANKNARIIWCLMARNEEYRTAA